MSFWLYLFGLFVFSALNLYAQKESQPKPAAAFSFSSLCHLPVDMAMSSSFVVSAHLENLSVLFAQEDSMICCMVLGLGFGD